MGQDDYYQDNQGQQQFDESAAQDAGIAAGRMEGAYDRADADARQDVNDVENIPANLSRDAEQSFRRDRQDVEDVPSDIGSAIKSAAGWLGDKIGGVEGEGRRVENDGRRAEGDVQQFGDNVDNSYNQGEQQGRQDGEQGRW